MRSSKDRTGRFYTVYYVGLQLLRYSGHHRQALCCLVESPFILSVEKLLQTTVVYLCLSDSNKYHFPSNELIQYN